jgi:hypothetical protein
MRLKVIQRFPNFFSGFIPESKEAVCSVEELINIPFVKRWVDNSDFDKLRKVIRKGKQHILICDLKNNKGSWGIAWLYGDVGQLNLPE